MPLDLIIRSPCDGIWYTRKVAVTIHALRAWCNGALIQGIMPNLHSLEREWLITSIPPEQWTDFYEPEVHTTMAPPGMIAVPMDKVRLGIERTRHATVVTSLIRNV